MSERLTLEQASELLGDDIHTWMANPFLSPSDRSAKALFWINALVAHITAAEGGSENERRCSGCSNVLEQAVPGPLTCNHHADGKETTDV